MNYERFSDSQLKRNIKEDYYLSWIYGFTFVICLIISGLTYFIGNYDLFNVLAILGLIILDFTCFFALRNRLSYMMLENRRIHDTRTFKNESKSKKN